MGIAQFQLEQRAYTALQAVYDEALRAQSLFKEAGLETPSPLLRLFGEDVSLNGAEKSLQPPPPLVEPSRPHGTGDNWMWVQCKDLTALTTAKCILRELGAPVPVSTLVEEISDRLGEGVSSNSLYNSGKRLVKSKKIVQTKRGWELTNESFAPIMWEGYAWGPLDVFSDFEIADFRRKCVVHVVSHANGGLSPAEIAVQLQKLDQFKSAGVSKEGVRADIIALDKEKLIKRTSPTKNRWVAA